MSDSTSSSIFYDLSSDALDASNGKMGSSAIGSNGPTNKPASPIHTSRRASVPAINAPEIYQMSRRCPVMLSAATGPYQSAPRTTQQAAELIFSWWESDHAKKAPGLADDNGTRSAMSTVDYKRQQHFSNYLLGLTLRAQVSVTTLLVAVVYLHRLRTKYPKASGQPGCAHRLAVSAVLVADRYLRGHSKRQVQLTTSQWAQISGCFTTDEIDRMESELITFMDGKLLVTAAQVIQLLEEERFIESYPGCSRVPELHEQLQWSEVMAALTPPAVLAASQNEPKSTDASCPNL